MIDWVEIKSWHVVKLTRSIEARTLCGRAAKVGAEIKAELPAGRSCESCLRILARQIDQ